MNYKLTERESLNKDVWQTFGDRKRLILLGSVEVYVHDNVKIITG